MLSLIHPSGRTSAWYSDFDAVAVQSRAEHEAARSWKDIISTILVGVYIALNFIGVMVLLSHEGFGV